MNTKFMLCGLMAVLFSTKMAAQLFTKITTGGPVTTAGDSRSVNWVDVNGDGFDDLFITNGPDGGQNNFMWLNQGNGTFSALANDPIVLDNSPSDGATFGDADNDGDLDCFMVTWYGEPNFYYENKGNGQFLHQSAALGGSNGTHSETASWGDYDRDGKLDLYLTNSFQDKKNQLWRSLGGGNWQQVFSGGTHLTEADASRSVNWTDYNNDGWPDLFVSNESQTANDLWKNLGGGQFEKVTAGSIVTSARSSMSSSWGDVNNDGWLDLFVANSKNFAPQNNQLWLNKSDGSFQEITTGELSTDGGCSFGSNFADFDNDGDLDLAVANGFCNGVIENFLYQNDGEGVFTRDKTSISSLETPCSYGLAWGDFDKNGFQDLAISTCQNTSGSSQPADILYKNNGNGNHWLQIRLIGTVSNRSCIGAKIRILAIINGQPVWQMRELSAQSGYCGQNSLVAHFGLRESVVTDSLVVEFPSGIRQVLTGQTGDQFLEITEDASLAAGEIAGFQEPFELEISPNPASEIVKIAAKFSQPTGKIRLRLIDSLGQVVHEISEKTGGSASWSGQLNLQKMGLSPGIFILEMQADEAVQRVSVVKN